MLLLVSAYMNQFVLKNVTTTLKDGEMVVVTRNQGYEIKTLDNVKLCREVECYYLLVLI